MKKQTPNFTKHPKHKVAPFVQGGKLVGPEEAKGQFSCHIMHIDSNKAFEPHIHPSSHLLIVLEGTGFLDTWHGELKILNNLKWEMCLLFNQTQNTPLVLAATGHVLSFYTSGKLRVCLDVM